jgi:glycosyltransferase involved in cell wall biosynthesis
MPGSRHNRIKSPESVVIGGGRFASFRRLAYSFLWRNRRDVVVYTPTHHGFWFQRRQVVTILDLIPLHHPAQHKFQYLYFKYLLPKILNRCRAVFTISRDAKNDIVRYYGINPSDVHVIPCGIDTSLFKVSAKIGSSDNYLLVVGASYPHKNIEELLQNWPLWKGRYTLKIVSCRGAYKQHLEEYIADQGLTENVEFLGYLSNDDLVALYQNCAALVFPSLWEGFGMPPLEAMACGRPSIVSDIPVHKEVMKGSALYITPGDPQSWREAFALMSDNETITQKLKAGEELVTRYTWDASGEALMQALLSVFPELKDLVHHD